MDAEAAARFVEQWAADWNAHDLEALLSHYRDDVVFTSPVSVQVVGGDGVIRGKAALRRYWGEGLPRIPDLHFEVIDHYVGVDTLVIHYRNQKGGLVAEVLTFDDGLVVVGHGTYRSGSDNPAGVRSA
jgi:ketosteroid isomerase-like protein